MVADQCWPNGLVRLVRMQRPGEERSMVAGHGATHRPGGYSMVTKAKGMEVSGPEGFSGLLPWRDVLAHARTAADAGAVRLDAAYGQMALFEAVVA